MEMLQDASLLSYETKVARRDGADEWTESSYDSNNSNADAELWMGIQTRDRLLFCLECALDTGTIACTYESILALIDPMRKHMKLSRHCLAHFKNIGDEHVNGSLAVESGPSPPSSGIAARKILWVPRYTWIRKAKTGTKRSSKKSAIKVPPRKRVQCHKIGSRRLRIRIYSPKQTR